MTVVRANPLPLGVYWLDVWAPSVGSPNTPNGEVQMAAWLAANPAAVKVHRRDEFSDGALTPPNSGGWLTGPATIESAPFRFFYVFQVLAQPTNFPFEKLGFPTVVQLGAPEAIKPESTQVKSDDTVQKQPPQSPLDVVNDTLDVIQGAIGTAGLYAGLALGAFLGYKLLFDRK